MQLHSKAVATLVILDQTHHGTHGGVFDRIAKLFGRIDQSPVVARRISSGEQQLGVRPACLDSRFQWVSQRDIQQPVG